MILVILGAGASYDSVPALPPTGKFGRDQYPSRPPLAKDLFLNIDPFRSALNRFPECHQIVPYLQHIPDGQTIEQILEGLQTEAKEDVVRKRQLAAIQYYLHFVIWECEQQWSQQAGEITNYATLLDQLRRACSKEIVCIVTFNYDRMIENALTSVGIQIKALPTYIANEKIKLFKLHGSIHWGQEVRTSIGRISDSDPWKTVRTLIQNADTLKTSEHFEIVNDHPIGSIRDIPLFPAIAIPVQRKENFVCPREHLDCLQSLLPETKKMIVVGWRGTEYNFLDLLKQSFGGRRSIPKLVVSESEESAKFTLERLQEAGISGSSATGKKGFSDFVVSREAESFLAS